MPSLPRVVRARPCLERVAVAAAVAVAGSAAIVIEASADDAPDGPEATTVVATSPEPSGSSGAAELHDPVARTELVPVDDARAADEEAARAVGTGDVEATDDVEAAADAEATADAAGTGDVEATGDVADDGSSVSEAVWDELAECESSGDWSINTGNGYYGGLQFNLESWQWAGGDRYSAYPHEASREQQIEIAERLLEIHPAGWGAWPACAAQLGLR